MSNSQARDFGRFQKSLSQSDTSLVPRPRPAFHRLQYGKAQASQIQCLLNPCRQGCRSRMDCKQIALSGHLHSYYCSICLTYPRCQTAAVVHFL